MKIMFISDTHGNNEMIEVDKDIDILVHTGDFTRTRMNARMDLVLLLDWFLGLEVEYKIFIAGNHDKFIFENNEEAKRMIEFYNDKYGANIIYLEDSEVVIEGIKFYGSPWTPIFFNWYFMKNENELANYFNRIPEDTDILLTHGPAENILDRTHSNRYVGSSALRYKIDNLNNLKIHAFGHIHEDRGVIEKKGKLFINASANINDKLNYVVQISIDPAGEKKIEFEWKDMKRIEKRH